MKCFILTSQRFAMKSVYRLDSGKRQRTTTPTASEFEITALTRLKSHPNIISLFEVLETSDRLFLVMELAAGGNLRDYLSQQHTDSGLSGGR